MKTKFSLVVLICSITFNCFAQTDIKENTFNFKLKGNDSPVVIFESGLGETLKGWGQIQDSIAEITTTVSYDRLGLGKSYATEKPRTIENLVKELNIFLENNKIKGPYILVGHSLGGFIIRKFQHSYPEKVLGLVMIDPSHEQLLERVFASKPKEQAEMMRNSMNDFYAKQPIAIQNEFKEVNNMSNIMKEVKLPNSIPITIIASYQATPPFSPEDIKIKQELFNNWIKYAPQTELISTTKSGHYIHYSEPEIVIRAIIEMIDNVNRN
jgi:pimeloyl-ACP methyl ester carboxylesterase